MAVINSSVTNVANQAFDNIIVRPEAVTPSSPIIPIYANQTEIARAILTDTAFVAVNDDTMHATVALPGVIVHPPTIAVTYNSQLGDWVKANPAMAAGGALLVAYSIYLLTKKGRRK